MCDLAVSGETVESTTINRVRELVDEQTGRKVRQLTDFEGGAYLGYFRLFRQLPDGRLLARRLGVSRSQVSVLSGQTSRRKEVLVERASPGALEGII